MLPLLWLLLLLLLLLPGRRRWLPLRLQRLLMRLRLHVQLLQRLLLAPLTHLLMAWQHLVALHPHRQGQSRHPV